MIFSACSTKMKKLTKLHKKQYDMFHYGIISQRYSQPSFYILRIGGFDPLTSGSPAPKIINYMKLAPNVKLWSELDLQRIPQEDKKDIIIQK